MPPASGNGHSYRLLTEAMRLPWLPAPPQQTEGLKETPVGMTSNAPAPKSLGHPLTHQVKSFSCGRDGSRPRVSGLVVASAVCDGLPPRGRRHNIVGDTGLRISASW
jgi:hypothetical protein